MGLLAEFMKSFLEDLSNAVLQPLLDRTVDKLAGAKRTLGSAVRTGCLFAGILGLLALVGGSGWLVWTLTQPGQPVVAFRSLWWLAVLPAICVCTAAIVGARIAGGFRLSLLIQYAFWYASLILMLVNIVLDAIGRKSPTGLEEHWEIIAFLTYSLPLIVLAVVFEAGARVDLPSLTSPLARISYLGRYRHLRTLLELAATLGWQAKQPHGPHEAFTAMGLYSARHMELESGVRRVKLGEQGSRLFYLRVSAHSRANLWPLYTGTDALRPAWTADKRCFTFIYNDHKPTNLVYLLPPELHDLRTAQIFHLAEAISAGESHLGVKPHHRVIGKRWLAAEGQRLSFELVSQFRIGIDHDQLAAIMFWLLDVMEAAEVGHVGAVAPADLFAGVEHNDHEHRSSADSYRPHASSEQSYVSPAGRGA